MNPKLAFSTVACPDWSLERAIDEASRWGYDGLDLRLIDGLPIDPAMSVDDREIVAELLRDRGVHLASIDSTIRLVSDQAEVEVEEELLAVLDIAAAWSAPLVRVFGGDPPDGLNESDALIRAGRMLNRISREADLRGVKLGLETQDTFSSSLIVARVMSGVGSPGVGVVWDVLQTHAAGESPAEVWDRLGPRVLAVHLKDARRIVDDNGWLPATMGDGEVPIRDCLRVLEGGDYRGWLIVEWEKLSFPDIEEPADVLPHEIDVLRAWLAEDEGPL